MLAATPSLAQIVAPTLEGGVCVAGCDDESEAPPGTPDSLKPVYRQIRGNERENKSFLATREYIRACRTLDAAQVPERPKTFNWDYTVDEEEDVVRQCIINHLATNRIRTDAAQSKEIVKALDKSMEQAREFVIKGDVAPPPKLRTVYHSIKTDAKAREKWNATRGWIEECRRSDRHPSHPKPRKFEWKFVVSDKSEDDEIELVRESLDNYYIDKAAK